LHDNKYKILIIWIICASIIDAYATLFGVLSGSVQEANPLMESLISLGPSQFLIAKKSPHNIRLYDTILSSEQKAYQSSTAANKPCLYCYHFAAYEFLSAADVKYCTSLRLE
jgi:hypothetical protein